MVLETSWRAVVLGGALQWSGSGLEMVFKNSWSGLGNGLGSGFGSGLGLV